MLLREVAWRVFAEELNASTYQLESKEEREPSYIITPLGAKVNRIFVVGTLIDKTPGENLIKARISDPTDVFMLYIGRYQEQALRTIESLKVPSLVALVGKVRMFVPEEGLVYISIRPELIKEVNLQIKEYWVVETCKHTKARLDLIREAAMLSEPTIEKISALGASKRLAEGIFLALQHYKTQELEKYTRSLIDTLQGLVSVEKLEPKKELPEPTEKELQILELVEKLDSGKGTSWEKLLEKAKELKLTHEELEELINTLMDKGLLYEPILGRLKKI
jgi:hypothetical protein